MELKVTEVNTGKEVSIDIDPSGMYKDFILDLYHKDLFNVKYVSPATGLDMELQLTPDFDNNRIIVGRWVGSNSVIPVIGYINIE